MRFGIQVLQSPSISKLLHRNSHEDYHLLDNIFLNPSPSHFHIASLLRMNSFPAFKTKQGVLLQHTQMKLHTFKNWTRNFSFFRTPHSSSASASSSSYFSSSSSSPSSSSSLPPFVFLFGNMKSFKVDHPFQFYHSLAFASPHSSNFSHSHGFSAFKSNPKSKRTTKHKLKASKNAPPKSESNQVQKESKIKPGMLLEFERDQTKNVFGLVIKPDGKSNWIVQDSNDNTFSVSPRQISYIVSEKCDYTVENISQFIEKVDKNQDHSLLKLIWDEFKLTETEITVTEFAELLFLDSSPEHCFCAFKILSNDKIYFKKKKKNSMSYVARPPDQVESLRVLEEKRKMTEKELLNFVQFSKAEISKPFDQKLGLEKWKKEKNIFFRIQTILEFVLESFTANKHVAKESLEALGISATVDSAFDFLIRCGILPRHTHLSVLQNDTWQDFSPEVMDHANQLVENDPIDPDESRRIDLTRMKVYMVDSEDTIEVDDGISIEALDDGRKKIWVHVADPARWLIPSDIIDLEARRRGCSLYLCSSLVPMLPLQLAKRASLNPGNICPAMSVSILLKEDGSIKAVDVMNSSILPTYRLTYEEVNEMLAMGHEEEVELSQLQKVADLRRRYRNNQGSVEIELPEPVIKVNNKKSNNPDIHVTTSDPYDVSHRIISELMILCGEAVAKFASERNIRLPYRGQSEPRFPEKDEIQTIPTGFCRAVYLRQFMTRSEINCQKPISHACLGINGYVQFTSPLRRYGDLLSHFQVKAFLRGEALPYSLKELESSTVMAALRFKEAKKLESVVSRYWLLEYFSRLPKETSLKALVLRPPQGNETLASILLLEVGYETMMRTNRNLRLGDEINVMVLESNPRKNVLFLQESHNLDAISHAVASSQKFMDSLG